MADQAVMREFIEVYMTSSAFPPSPTGYQQATQFEYPRLLLQLLGSALLLLTTPLLLVITWLLQGRPNGLPLPLELTGLNLLLIALTIPTVIIVHELVHGLTYQWLGYSVSYGINIRLGAAYAAAFKQWQARRHNVLVALMPLISLTILLLPGLALPNQTVVLGMFMALLFNIGGSVGDLYLTWRLLHLPDNALLYDVDEKTMLIYLPDMSEDDCASN